MTCSHKSSSQVPRFQFAVFVAIVGVLFPAAMISGGQTPPQNPGGPRPLRPTVQNPESRTSIEGIVVRWGTMEPVSGADVELTLVDSKELAQIDALIAARDALRSVGIPYSVNVGAVASAPLPLFAKTGNDGKFSFNNVIAGTYRLIVACVGGAYTPAEYGQRDPRGRGIALTVRDQSIRDLKLEMAPTGTISGRVFDADGESLARVSVMVLQDAYKNGRRVLNIIQATQSDDRGIYEFFWLPPGRYRIAAKLEDEKRHSIPLFTVLPGRAGPNERTSAPVVIGRTLATGETIEEAFSLVYFGGSADPALAQPVDLPPGGAISAVDIPMSSGRQRAFHIQGTVINGETGQPSVGRAMLRAFPLTNSANPLVLEGRVDSKGAFDLAGAVPGKYLLFATTDSFTTNYAFGAILGNNTVDYLYNNIYSFGLEGLNAALPLEIQGADVKNLIVTVRRGVTLLGKITIEGRPQGGAVPDITQIRPALVREPEVLGMPTAIPGAWQGLPAYSQPNGVPGADGSFTLKGVTDGDYRLVPLPMPPNSYLKSIRMGASDVLRDGLHIKGPTQDKIEILIATDTSSLSGVVTDGTTRPAPNATVALVPDRQEFRRRFDLYRSAISDAKGQFQLANVPPGTYKIFAWNYAEPDAWQNSEFIRPYDGFGRLVQVGGVGQNITVNGIELLR